MSNNKDLLTYLLNMIKDGRWRKLQQIERHCHQNLDNFTRFR